MRISDWRSDVFSSDLAAGHSDHPPGHIAAAVRTGVTVWSRDGDDLILSVRLTPGAAREEVGGVWTDDKGANWLSARARAVPDRGKANAALIAPLAQRLDWTRGASSLESADLNRIKRLRELGRDSWQDTVGQNV